MLRKNMFSYRAMIIYIPFILFKIMNKENLLLLKSLHKQYIQYFIIELSH